MTKKKSKINCDFEIPQLKQRIHINSLRLTERQKHFLSISFNENTKIVIELDEQKEIIRIIVSKEQSNRVFESMYLAGDLDTPGKGIMWMVKLDRVATHIPKDVLKRAGATK